MRIERARPSDVRAVEALLAASGLPVEGAADALSRGVVARDGSVITGVAAVERHGTAGLLRSVAVAPDHRGTGLGRSLVAAAEDLARADGIVELYLLTETAAGWFPRLGYAVVSREEAAAAVGRSVELTTLCGSTSVAMRRELAGPGGAR